MLARIHQTIIGAAIAVALTAGATHAQTASAPQTVVPTPLPPSANPDTPGGAARNGVIAPPAPGADAEINRDAPPTSAVTPIIPPPGSPGGNPSVVPK